MPPKFLQTYANEVSRHLDYLPTWPLDYKVKLGDVGILDGNVFKRTDTLEALGIQGFAVRRGRGTQLLEFSSREGVEVTSTIGGESAIQGLGGEVEIKFSRDGAVFLQTGEHTIEQFESTDALGIEILKRYESGEWKRNRVVVTEVVKAAAAIVLVSGSGSASARFKLDASLPATQALAGGKLSQLVSVTGSFTTKIVGENVSPLLRICGLRGLFQKEFKSGKSQTGSSQKKGLKFARIDSSEQLEE
jgi:hypothetical protein